MSAEHLPYHDITEKVIGVAMKVHNHFGCGFIERVYQQAMEIEFQKIGMKVETEVCKRINYDGIFISLRRLDMVIDDKVLIELKSSPIMDKRWSFVMRNYLRVFELPVGLLINFGDSSLIFKRFYNPDILRKGEIL